MANLLTTPSIVGVGYELPNYNVLGAGTTDRIFLLGHADAPELNNPYQVVNMPDTLQALNGDTTTPLYRSMLEAYYSGARDIWLVPVAPMSEYRADFTLRDHAYYQTYADRLAATYSLLREWDIVQMVCPIEAPFYNAFGVDFLTPLISHCASSFANTGSIRLGFLGTRTGIYTEAMIDDMVTDSRIQSLNGDGKFCAVIVGEGTFNFKELPFYYAGMVHIAAAAQYATMLPSQSLTWTKLNTPIQFANGKLKAAQRSALANAKLNPVWKTSLGERGTNFQTLVMTDNTLGATGSDYWSLLQVRLVSSVVEDVRRIGRRYLGTIGFGTFKQDLQSYFVDLFHKQYIRNFTLNVVRDPLNFEGALVDISIKPFFGLRQLTFTVAAGPGG